jgi:endonuclease-3
VVTPVPKRGAGQPRPRSRRRTHPTADPARAWARRLNRTRPGLTEFVLDGLATIYGHPRWQRRNDPTSELVLTILAQNSADTNAEQAFESLRRRFPFGRSVEAADAPPPGSPPNGWGGLGLRPGDPPDWPAVETAPIEEVVDAIRPGGLANQKAPRIQAALRAIREERGDHSLEFLGSMAPPDALAWLTAIGGIGVKTASIVLLFCFGIPFMPVDRHVERVSKRLGLVPAKATPDDAHQIYGHLLAPERIYEAHVNLITHGRRLCHALRPEHERCPLIDRCRFVDPKAP